MQDRAEQAGLRRMDVGQPLLQAKQVNLVYQDGQNAVRAVKDVSLSVHPGEFVGILGPSGSGKTSLLYILAGIRHPTSGRVFLNGEAVHNGKMPVEAVRRRNFGVVFQQYFLINYLSAFQNILVGALTDAPETRARARGLLAKLGLEGLERRKPYALSGGQRQRVAIARALMNEPQVVFADEPTANLDHTSGAAVMELLAGARGQSALIVVSHDETALRGADTLYKMWDGALERVR